jgi:hypothetical protein
MCELTGVVGLLASSGTLDMLIREIAGAAINPARGLK